MTAVRDTPRPSSVVAGRAATHPAEAAAVSVTAVSGREDLLPSVMQARKAPSLSVGVERVPTQLGAAERVEAVEVSVTTSVASGREDLVPRVHPTPKSRVVVEERLTAQPAAAEPVEAVEVSATTSVASGREDLLPRVHPTPKSSVAEERVKTHPETAQETAAVALERDELQQGAPEDLELAPLNARDPRITSPEGLRIETRSGKDLVFTRDMEGRWQGCFQDITHSLKEYKIFIGYFMRQGSFRRVSGHEQLSPQRHG